MSCREEILTNIIIFFKMYLCYLHFNKKNIRKAGKSLQLLYLSLNQVVINFVNLLMKGL